MVDESPPGKFPDCLAIGRMVKELAHPDKIYPYIEFCDSIGPYVFPRQAILLAKY